MGMRGPLPKATRSRVRDQRRRDAAMVVLEPKKDSAPDVPTLPGDSLPEAVLEWWATLWRSPIAAEFRDVDRPGLTRLARLWAKSLSARGCSGPELAEIRQLEDRYGLNPTSRRRLGWKLEAPAAPSETSPVSKGVTAVAEYRRRLGVVA